MHHNKPKMETYMKEKENVVILLLMLGLVLVNSGCGKEVPVSEPSTAAVFPTNLEFEQPEALK